MLRMKTKVQVPEVLRIHNSHAQKDTRVRDQFRIQNKTPTRKLHKDFTSTLRKIRQESTITSLLSLSVHCKSRGSFRANVCIAERMLSCFVDSVIFNTFLCNVHAPNLVCSMRCWVCLNRAEIFRRRSVRASIICPFACTIRNEEPFLSQLRMNESIYGPMWLPSCLLFCDLRSEFFQSWSTVNSIFSLSTAKTEVVPVWILGLRERVSYLHTFRQCVTCSCVTSTRLFSLVLRHREFILGLLLRTLDRSTFDHSFLPFGWPHVKIMSLHNCGGMFHIRIDMNSESISFFCHPQLHSYARRYSAHRTCNLLVSCNSYIRVHANIHTWFLSGNILSWHECPLDRAVCWFGLYVWDVSDVLLFLSPCDFLLGERVREEERFLLCCYAFLQVARETARISFVTLALCGALHTVSDDSWMLLLSCAYVIRFPFLRVLLKEVSPPCRFWHENEIIWSSVPQASEPRLWCFRDCTICLSLGLSDCRLASTTLTHLIFQAASCTDSPKSCQQVCQTQKIEHQPIPCRWTACHSVAAIVCVRRSQGWMETIQAMWSTHKKFLPSVLFLLQYGLVFWSLLTFVFWFQSQILESSQGLRSMEKFSRYRFGRHKISETFFSFDSSWPLHSWFPRAGAVRCFAFGACSHDLEARWIRHFLELNHFCFFLFRRFSEGCSRWQK